MAVPSGGRDRRKSEGGLGVHKRGDGFGTGPVGNKEGYAGRPGSSSAGKTASGSSSSPQQSQGSPGKRSGGGGMNPIMIIIVLAVVLLGGGGGLSGLLGGGGGSSSSGTSTTGNSGSSGYSSSSGHASGSSYGYGGSSGSTVTDLLGSLLGEASGSGYGSSYGNSYGSSYGNSYGSSYGSTGSSSGSYSSGSSGSYGNTSGSSSSSSGSSSSGGLLGTLFSALGSSSGQSLSGTYSNWSGDNNTGNLNTTVNAKAGKKLTKIKGNGKDVVTIMIYMCGTDLESRNGMGTSDLSEISRATVSGNVNILIYTGGCQRWKNSVVSSRVNQIYQAKNGGVQCLVQDDGDRVMTDPETLTRFIKWCTKNFPANRNELIFWDHGGGSVSGYGYDEKHARSGAMSLPSIKSAVKNSGATFDIIGFDACLMATAENALALADYADYLLASEETEPGTGWYYTDWITALSKNTSIPTTDLGRKIIDDFITTSAKQCRGQSTTLSLVDLAELKATFPKSFSTFAGDINELLDNKEFTTIATARRSTREFGRSARINQYDLVHLAKNLGTDDALALADTVLSAVKYNRTSSDMTNSYGLAIYFPSQNSRTDSMSATYQQLNLDSGYAGCFRKIAAVQEAGQAASGGSHSLGDLLSGSLFGAGTGTDYFGSSSGSDMMGQLLGSLFSGRSMGDYSTDFIEDSGYSQSDLENMLVGNTLDPDQLVWNRNGSLYSIHLSPQQWSLVEGVEQNMFFDDGEGFIDLGLDTLYDVTEDGDLVCRPDRYWISINKQPVAYYHISTTLTDEGRITIGRVPCLLNGDQASLIIVFDPDSPDGYVAGAVSDYINDETDTVAKSMIGLKVGDEIDFVCDYYNYDQEFQKNYYLGETMTIEGTPEISSTDVGEGGVMISYRFTDIYGQRYWTPPIYPD